MRWKEETGGPTAHGECGLSSASTIPSEDWLLLLLLFSYLWPGEEGKAVMSLDLFGHMKLTFKSEFLWITGKILRIVLHYYFKLFSSPNATSETIKACTSEIWHCSVYKAGCSLAGEGSSPAAWQAVRTPHPSQPHLKPSTCQVQRCRCS